MIDGKLQLAVGVVVNTFVMIADAQTHIPLQVINFSFKTLLLGTNWLDRYKADILSNTRKLKFKYQGCTIEVNVINSKDQTVLDKSNLNML